uniref:Integrase catalytic domain-containing protein n=1 Tax=Chromera velia CCMP2878 TaxID=1169474 RepID=A0A0G4GDX4_9ALVE|eukprot:Cvel_21473.t1-p1 / transcript=Cvel_21473.t1 / gene=Cvel_21473 / organism=Chromera_velia_CCMP2878 / gene_product=Pro-Pol polyprotein, putative / transcript_product=Pro-Pol polyprotein, putative / location=Cvel_scaffold2016:16182-18423(-) / protein_length=624 / sequence_SO=supercontig / SO=protein_coding / is_pseudo=false
MRATLWNAEKRGWEFGGETDEVRVVTSVESFVVVTGEDDGEMIADSGASKSLVPPSFDSYVSALSGQAEISPENRSHLLFVLHSRLGHATGQRLEATLKEKGVGVQFSVKECKEVRDTCKAYRVVNFWRRKLKRRGAAAGTRKRSRKGDESFVHEDDKEKEPEPTGPGGQFNADIYYDLKDMKRKGIGGFRYMSVIIDLQTRRKSLWVLRLKDHAVRHLISWTCWWEKAGKGKPKVVHSDNGGEFISDLYLSFCLSVEGGGIVTQFGPPLTPEVQAFVKRENDDFSSLLNKVLFQRSLPFYLWPVFILGIANSLNEVVHGSTGLSPNCALFGVRSGVPPVAPRDVQLVHLSDPSHRQRFITGGPVKKSERALFGGVISLQSVSVLIRRGRQWRPLRVHPSHIQMESWLGVEHINFDEDGRSDVIAERKTDSVMGRGSVWVGWGEEDNRSDADNAETGGETSDEDVSHLVCQLSRSPRGVRVPRLQGVLARWSDGALFPGQIVKEGEKQVRSITAARLKQRDDGSFFPAELETVKQKDIVERFELPADGQLPPAVLDRLTEQAPPVPDPVPPVPSDKVPVDVDVVADQAAEEANTAEFLRWTPGLRCPNLRGGIRSVSAEGKGER